MLNEYGTGTQFYTVVSFFTREKFISFIKFVKCESSLGRYVFGSEISYNKAPPRLPGLGC